MRKFAVLLTVLTVLLCLAGCGESYVCSKCDKTTTKAYYDFDGNKNSPLCADCAEEYWAPFDYENYKIK